MKTALVTGITGQDGSYLAEQLLERGYEVVGLVRRSSSPNTHRIDAILPRVTVRWGDLLDSDSLNDAVSATRPDEIYHLAAQSDVGLSFKQPVLTTEVNALGTVRLLQAVRRHAPDARMYVASTSEMFGNAATTPQSESTPFAPRSPYGAAKVYAHHMAVHYRQAYGMFIACGIGFNHESPRRGERFVTQKVARQVARIARGEANELSLGNMAARRDWGFAPDYTDAMWRMLQVDEPDDYVLATGESHSVAELVERAFAIIGRDPAEFVRSDPEMQRPTDVDHLRGDATRARLKLGWTPTVRFDELVERMVRAQLGEPEPVSAPA